MGVRNAAAGGLWRRWGEDSGLGPRASPATFSSFLSLERWSHPLSSAPSFSLCGSEAHPLSPRTPVHDHGVTKVRCTEHSWDFHSHGLA